MVVVSLMTLKPSSSGQNCESAHDVCLLIQEAQGGDYDDDIIAEDESAINPEAKVDMVALRQDDHPIPDIGAGLQPHTNRKKDVQMDVQSRQMSTPKTWIRWSVVPAELLYRQSHDEAKALPDAVAHVSIINLWLMLHSWHF